MTEVFYQQFQKQRFFNSLDGLRFVSIIAVIWHHTAYNQGYLTSVSGFKDGYLGVHFFFAISGFLITTLMLREKKKYGFLHLKNFYMRRTLRIFPLYYAVLLLIYTPLVYFLENNGVRKEAFFDNLWAYATYTSNWFVKLDAVHGTIFYFAWSLAAEEQFYLVWPVVEKWIKEKVIILSITLLTTFKVYMDFGWFPDFFSEGSLIYIVVDKIPFSILFGVLGAHALHHPRTFHWLWQLTGGKLNSIFIILCLLLSIILEQHIVLTSALMTLMVISCVIRDDHLFHTFLRFPIFAKIGLVSYGMYLTHMLCANIVLKLIPTIHPMSYFLLTCLVNFGVAWILFHTLEQYFLKLKGKFTRA
jgi:peptidoglycan/LPS O-acetylase OafA/YrhL